MEIVVKINLKMEAIDITNALAYSATVVITTVKSCTVQPPVACIIKLLRS
jgi:hypothetical protein